MRQILKSILMALALAAAPVTAMFATVEITVYQEGQAPLRLLASEMPAFHQFGADSFVLKTSDTSLTLRYSDVGIKVLSDELPSLQNGDVNGDGQVDVADIMCLLGLLVEQQAGDSLFLDAADVDGDGTVTLADVQAIMDLLAGKN